MSLLKAEKVKSHSGLEGLKTPDAIPTNGTAVEVVNVGGTVRRKSPGTIAEKTVPAGKPPWHNFCKVPANDKVVKVNGFVQSRKSQYYIKN
jgi:hypothetical protein